MYTTTIFSVAMAAIGLVSAQSTGELGDAAVVSNNPVGISYTATLPEEAFTKTESLVGNVKGSIQAVANPDGVGVNFKVNFSNLPTSGGPFVYHVHVEPVPEDGNCTSTLAHLDPYIRGEVTPCDAASPATCQVGDLAGKHGKIESDPFEATYTDQYVSTLSGLGSFFGNRSIVVHYANKTRITCANFQLTGPATNTSGNGTTAPTATPAPFTGAGEKTAASLLYILGLASLAAFMI